MHKEGQRDQGYDDNRKKSTALDLGKTLGKRVSTIKSKN